MDGRLGPVPLRHAAEQKIQPTWETLPSSHQPNSQAVFPEKPLLGSSEESHDGSIQHDFGSLRHRREEDDFSDSRESRHTVVEDKPFVNEFLCSGSQSANWVLAHKRQRTRCPYRDLCQKRERQVCNER